MNFVNADIFLAKSLNPFSHIYQFDLGFEPPLHNYIANMFNKSTSCQYLISYRRPLEIKKYGYKVTHLQELDLSTSMSGSGEHHTCYFYIKAGLEEKNNPIDVVKLSKKNLSSFLVSDDDNSSDDTDSIADTECSLED